MFSIKNISLRKLQKRKIKRIALTNNKLTFGSFGLKVFHNCCITKKQLEMMQNLLLKNTKKFGKFWVKIFPWCSVTSKPLEVRMGKGKGFFDYWMCKVKSGSILIELSGLSKKKSLNILHKLIVKLPFKFIIIEKKRNHAFF